MDVQTVKNIGSLKIHGDQIGEIMVSLNFVQILRKTLIFLELAKLTCTFNIQKLNDELVLDLH